MMLKWGKELMSIVQGDVYLHMNYRGGKPPEKLVIIYQSTKHHIQQDFIS
jgi:hypothetical protein